MRAKGIRIQRRGDGTHGRERQREGVERNGKQEEEGIKDEEEKREKKREDFYSLVFSIPLGYQMSGVEITNYFDIIN
jgi:hypothetical protein